MLSSSIWFSAPRFWMGGGLKSRCLGRVYGADGAVRLAPSKPYTRPTHLPSLKCNEQQCWRSISTNPQLWTSTQLTLSVSNVWYTAAASWKTSIYRILRWFIPISHVPFPLLWSYQRISLGWRHMYRLRVYASFYGEDLLVPRPTSKLEDHTLSAVRDCFFDIFAATHVIGGRSSRRDLRMHVAMVTGTHL